jgi:hypothetical protein
MASFGTIIRTNALPRRHPLLTFRDGVPVATVRLDDFGGGRAAIRLASLISGYARAMDIETLDVNAGPAATGRRQKTGWTHFIRDSSELEGIAAVCKQMKKELSQ